MTFAIALLLTGLIQAAEIEHARTALRQGDLIAAEHWLERAGTGDPVAVLLRGNVAYERGNAHEARRLWEESWRLESGEATPPSLKGVEASLEAGEEVPAALRNLLLARDAVSRANRLDAAANRIRAALAVALVAAGLSLVLLAGRN